MKLPIPPDPDLGVVVLCSGGVDSLVCARLAQNHGVLRGLVLVDYGQPAAQAEAIAVRRAAASFAFNVPVRMLAVDGLYLASMAAPDTGPCVVPGRNAVLLALAANVAVELGARVVYIGTNQADHEAYPDCRREFVWAMMDATSKACGVLCRAPLGDLTKAEVIAVAQTLGISPTDAWACYSPVAANQSPCGECASCRESAAAWRAR